MNIQANLPQNEKKATKKENKEKQSLLEKIEKNAVKKEKLREGQYLYTGKDRSKTLVMEAAISDAFAAKPRGSKKIERNEKGYGSQMGHFGVQCQSHLPSRGQQIRIRQQGETRVVREQRRHCNKT